MHRTVDISVVVPVLDEEPSLGPLHAEIVAALEPTGRSFEIVFVDDRSRDGSLARMLALRERDGRVRVVAFAARAGQTAALAAGFERARGAVVVTIDGDLQNDPADIPRLLDELGRGRDVVAGWRRQRHDGLFLRRLPSWIANRLIARVTGVPIHDTGCTLKAFRRELVERLPIYAEQHRFLPVLAAKTGARVSEIAVNHRPRRHGRSKYGLGRATRVLLDLVAIQMVASFSQRPLSYFVLLSSPFGLAVAVFALSLLFSSEPIRFDTAWARAALTVYMVLSMVCAYFVMLGLLAELVVKASDLHRPGRWLVSGPDSAAR